MMSSAVRRGMALPLLCLVAVACSTKPKSDPASDPNAPAVVRGVPVVLPSDTMKPDTMARHAQVVGDAVRELTRDYAVLGAAIAFGDQNMIGASFAPDARLVTPESTFNGVAAIANSLSKLGPAKSLRDFRRQSLVTRVVDSTVVDSGSFIVLTKRPGADSIFERGHYATVWRMHAPPFNWLITRDHLYRDPVKRKK